MSEFREYEPLKESDMVTFKDLLIISRLLTTKKLSDKQREAIRRLVATYHYMTD